MINSVNRNSTKLKTNESENKVEYTLSPKKYFIKRVSGEKNYQNLKSREYLPDQTSQVRVDPKAKNQRNRIKSLNAHGINVVSLKKLKVHRQINNDKSS